MHDLTTHDVPLADLHLLPGNPRQGDIGAVAESMKANGVYQPVVVNKGTHTGRPMEVIAGNHRVQAARHLGHDTIPAVLLDVDDEAATRIALADNRTGDLADYDHEALVLMLQSLPDLTGTGYDGDDLDDLLADLSNEGGPLADPTASLADRFGVPPFTVLNAREGAWQDRKRAWIALGIESEVGRDSDLVYSQPQKKYLNWWEVKNEAQANAGRTLTDAEVLEAPEAAKLSHQNGTSVFDPALCELLYRWHTRRGDHITDPWAGGSVRGVVAAALGRHYTGHELREVQVEANRAQWDTIRARLDDTQGPIPNPGWIAGDSRATLADRPTGTADYLIGCPPYYDLETYSDDPADLSNLSTAEFDAAMADTMRHAARVLRDDRFATFIVGNVRDKRGTLRSMHALMVQAAEAAGLTYAQDAILLTPIGSARTTSARSFQATRALGRVHQEVMTFVKGSRKKAAERLGDVDVQATLDAAPDE